MKIPVPVSEHERLAALRESEEHYRSVVEGQTEFIVRWRPDGTRTFVNEAYARYFGQTSAQLIGTSFFPLIPEAEREAVRRKIATITPDNPLATDEHRAVRADGVERWQQWVDRGIFDAKGRLVELQSVGRDIHERKQAELVLATFASLGHRLSSAVTRHEAAQIIVEAAEQLLGWDACTLDLYDARTDTVRSVLTMDIVEGQRRPVAGAYQDEPPTPRMRRIMQQGGQLTLRQPPFVAEPDLVPFGDTDRLSASILTVLIRNRAEVIGVLSLQSYTPNAYRPEDLQQAQALADHCGGALEQIRGREALIESEARHHAVLESALDAIITINHEGKVVEFNPAAEQMFGCARNEAIGREMADLIIPPAMRARHRRGLAHFLATGEASVLNRRIEWTAQRADGAEFPVELSIQRIGRTQPPLFTGFIRDIHERKQAELRLAAFCQLGQRLNVTSDAKTAAQIIVEIADQLFGWEACTFDIYDSERDVCHAVLNMDSIAGHRQSVPPRRTGEPPTARIRKVLREGGQLILREEPVTMPPDALPFGDGQRPSASIMIVPIRHGSKAVGTLSIQSYKVRAYAAEDLRTFQALADYCGGAMERIHGRASLKESEERFVKAFQANPAAVSIATVKDGRLIDVNERYRQFFGYTRDEVVGRTVSQLKMWADPAHRAPLIQLLLTNRSVRDYEGKLRRKDGVVRDALMAVELIDYPGESEPVLIAMFSDITERKRMEEERSVLTQRNAALVEALAEIVYDWNVVADEVRWGGEFTRILGYSDQEIGADTASWTSRVHPEDLPKVLVEVEQATRERRLYDLEYRFRHRDGHYLWMHDRGVLSVNAQGELQRITGVFRDITGRKRAEAALRDSEERFSKAFRSSPVTIAISTYPEGRYVDVNEHFTRTLGYTREEVLGHRTLDLGIWARPRQRADIIAALERGEAVRKVEVLLRAKSGELRHMLVSVERINLGEQPCLLFINHDITERKRVEETLARERSLLRTLIDNLPVYLYVKDTDGRYLTTNRLHTSLVGVADESELLGKTVSDFFPPEVARLYDADDQAVIRTGQPVIDREEPYEIGGERGWFSTTKTPLRDAQGKIIGLVGITQDITERKRAGEALRRKEAGLRESQRIGKVGSWEADLVLNTLDWSEETYRIFGREPATFSPTNEAFFDSVHPGDRDRVLQASRESIQSGRPYAIDHCILRPDGSERVVHEQAETVLDAQGRVARLIGTVQDITDRSNLEAQVRQSQKMDSIGHLAGGVAHDFNNILTIIEGHASLLLSSGALAQTEAESAREIAAAAERAANLIRQLLTFGRRQVMQPKRLDLNEVIGDTAQMLRRVLGEDIALHVNFAPQLPPILADQVMIEQVLVNLAVNSRDAMPKGGQLTIDVVEATLDEQQARAMPGASPGRFAGFKVTDTGCGIASKHLPHIFEPFFTTKDVGKGTGLGLASVYGIVQQHQGWIDVRSQPGEATTFQVLFPAVVAGYRAAKPRPEEKEIRGGYETILIVEDEPSLLAMVRAVLERWGYTVLEAPSGVAALEVWREHHERVDLLLTDMVMPDGVSGMDLAAKLLIDRPRLKVIFTSGYSVDIFGKELKLTDGLNFLQKPYPPQKLAQTVRDCLDGRAAPA